MVRIKSFHAVRPRPDIVERVASVPYDVVNTQEARELAADNPYSFLHIVRPEIDLPEETPPHAPKVYERAAQNYRKLLAEGILVREEEPMLYLYRLETELQGRPVSQTGIVGCCHIDDYNRGTIKKHEKTRKDKEDDRVRHVLTVGANTGPVFLLYKKHPALASRIRSDSEEKPLYDFTAPDGVRHTLWRIRDAAPYLEAFAGIEAVYIADGHHRSASAARAGVELRARNPEHRGDEEYNWFLTVLFPSDELSILPYNRVVKDLNGLLSEEFLRRVRSTGRVDETDKPSPGESGSFAMYLDGKWYRIRVPEEEIDRNDPIRSLDYVLLYDRILAPVLGIGDIRTDPRIDFVGGIRGTDELVKRVDSGESAVAFAMNPVTIEQLIAVADAGAIMPPKSTWFEPKLRSGLLVHEIK